MNFETKIESRNVSVYRIETKLPSLKGLIEGDDFEIVNAKFTVFWSVRLETQGLGIRSLDSAITDIVGSFDVEIFDPTTRDVATTETVKFYFADFADQSEIEILGNGCITVSDLDIDYSDMTVAVC